MNGYMSADVLGKTRGIKFGMIAIQQIMTKIESGMPEVAILYELLYWGLWNNCYVKKEVPDFSFEEVCDYVDANISDVKLWESLSECFRSSSVIKEADGGKKKAASTLPKRKGGMI